MHVSCRVYSCTQWASIEHCNTLTATDSLSESHPTYHYRYTTTRQRYTSYSHITSINATNVHLTAHIAMKQRAAACAGSTLYSAARHSWRTVYCCFASSIPTVTHANTLQTATHVADFSTTSDVFHVCDTVYVLAYLLTYREHWRASAKAIGVARIWRWRHFQRGSSGRELIAFLNFSRKFAFILLHNCTDFSLPQWYCALNWAIQHYY